MEQPIIGVKPAKSVWVTLLWIYYLILFLNSIGGVFFALILFIHQGNSDLTVAGASASPSSLMAFSAVNLVGFGILFFLCTKRRKSAIKAVPVIEMVLLISSLTLFIASADQLVVSALLVAILTRVIRPAVSIFMVNSNRSEFQS